MSSLQLRYRSIVMSMRLAQTTQNTRENIFKTASTPKGPSRDVSPAACFSALRCYAPFLSSLPCSPGVCLHLAMHPRRPRHSGHSFPWQLPPRRPYFRHPANQASASTPGNNFCQLCPPPGHAHLRILVPCLGISSRLGVSVVGALFRFLVSVIYHFFSFSSILSFTLVL